MNYSEEILNKFSLLVGADSSADGKTMASYNLKTKMELLARAQVLDPSNMLLLMLIEEEVDQVAKSSSTTIAAYLEDDKPFLTKIEQVRELRSLLLRSGMYEARDALRSSVLRALRHYGADQREDVKDLIAKRSSVATLWRDALECMETRLDTYQFMQGEPETNKPQYMPSVLGFWSVNDILRIVSKMPNGISLCMVRDNDAIHSYFCFAVRNGGMLTVITDRDRSPHPLAKQMSRRADRALDARMARSFFPYELLNVQYLEDEDGDIVGMNVPRQEGIIPQQTRAYKMKPIAQIGAAEIVWTAFMFALLTKRFFVENKKLPELSYTGEMVEIPQVLEIVAVQANLPVAEGVYKPLRAERLTSSTMVTDTVLAEAGIKKSTRQNEWMELRYKDQVSDEILNLVAAPTTATTLLTPSGQIQEHRHINGNEIGIKLERFDATCFGTAEQVLADRVWIGRHNQAKAIDHLASLEFTRREKEIKDWWAQAVAARKDDLVRLIIERGELVVHSTSLISYSFKNKAREDRNILSMYSLPHQKHLWNDTVIGEPLLRNGSYTGSYRCAITGRPASIVGLLRPQVADDLAAILGIAVKQLPDVLQHWTADDLYAGNCILDRIDPLEWVVTNPWRKIKFGINIYLSPFAYPKTARPNFTEYDGWSY